MWTWPSSAPATPGCGRPYYLARADPGLRIAVIEAEIAGFGASGRNGGWCSALFPRSVAAMARRHGRADALALYRAMAATVDEVGRVVGRRGHRLPLRQGRAPSCWRATRPSGPGPGPRSTRPARSAWTSTCWAPRRRGPGAAPPTCSAAPTRRTAPRSIPPGWSAVWLGPSSGEASGSSSGPRSPRSRRGGSDTSLGAVRAEVVVRATEGYTRSLRGHRRTLVPVYSLMVATEPLPESFWSEVGLAARETFSDERHLIIYGQRTVDDRLAFGGRGAPYHFGSTIRPEFDSEPGVHAELVPGAARALPGHRRTPDHTPVGRTARESPATGPPRSGWTGERGLAWAGGYVGDGVGTSNLAGRTLADLITRQASDLVRLPWVGHRSPALGARAAAVDRHQRRPAGDGVRRRGREPNRSALPSRPPLRSLARPVILIEAGVSGPGGITRRWPRRPTRVGGRPGMRPVGSSMPARGAGRLPHRLGQGDQVVRAGRGCLDTRRRAGPAASRGARSGRGRGGRRGRTSGARRTRPAGRRPRSSPRRRRSGWPRLILGIRCGSSAGGTSLSLPSSRWRGITLTMQERIARPSQSMTRHAERHADRDHPDDRWRGATLSA